MDIRRQTIALCRQYGIQPARSKGQNFLIDEKACDDMARASGLSAKDTVLEAGPGLGFLTARLARQAGRVIAVELDDKLAGALKAGLAANKIGNVEVMNEDILKIPNFQDLISNKNNNSLIGNWKLEIRNWKIVANLPYNITSIFLRKFLSGEHKPSSMVLMLQREVAERVCAHPPDMSLLAVSVQFYAEPEIIRFVPKSAFWPEPDVDSAIIKLKVKSNKLKVNESRFFQMVKFGFSARRKMLKNNLAAGYRISQQTAAEMLISTGFDPQVRAEALSFEDWSRLFGIINQNML